MRPRLLRILIKLALLSGGCVVGFLCAEAAVRIFFPHARDHVVPAGLFRIDENLGWVLVPQQAGIHRSRDFEVEYRSNELGFRDPDRDVRRTPGTYRILVYGDSQVFGWGLPATQRFTNLLESRIESTEIWNLGVPGYGLGQQVVAYETAGVHCSADEVCFFVDSSTLFRIPAETIYRKPKPRFRLDVAGNLQLDPVDAKSSLVAGTLYPLLSPFHLPYFIDRRLQIVRQSRARNTPSSLRAGPSFDDLARKILLRAKKRADSLGQRACILAGPFDASSSSQRNVEMSEVRAFADQSGLALLEIRVDPLNENLIFWLHDRHWNRQANERIGEQLYNQLLAL